MTVLVTGGVGLHRLARRRPAGRARPRAAHLRSRPVDVEPQRRRRAVVGDLLDRGTARAARCEVATPSSTSQPSRTWTPSLPTRRAPTSSTPAAPSVVLEAARADGVSRFVYASTVWVYGDAEANGRRSTRTRRSSLPEPLLHGDEARGRDVLPLVRRAVRARARRSCASGFRTGRGARPAAVVARLRRARPRRRAARHRRRRAPVSPVRLRRGPRPRASSPRSASRRQGRPVQPRRRRDRRRVREIADQVRELVGDVPIVHVPGRGRRCDDAAGLGRARGAGARLAHARPVRRRASARYVDWVDRHERLAERGDGLAGSPAAPPPSGARSPAQL